MTTLEKGSGKEKGGERGNAVPSLKLTNLTIAGTSIRRERK